MAVSSLKEDVTDTKSHLDKKEDLEILDWLSPTDYGPQQADYLRIRQPGTGQWLLDSKEYRNWVNESSKTLFCPGIPGAGKTILTSIVIDDLEKRFRTETTTAVAYVFYNYKSQDEQTPEALLSSLLKQLAQNHPSLPHRLRELCNQHKRKRTRLSLDELSQVLELVAAQSSKVFIVADALNECRTADSCRTKFLSAIFSLQDKTGVNIFATSRPIPDITDQFRGAVSMQILATKDDIQKYLHGHLPELPKFVTKRPDIRDKIVTKITDAVDGMYGFFFSFKKR